MSLLSSHPVRLPDPSSPRLARVRGLPRLKTPFPAKRATVTTCCNDRMLNRAFIKIQNELFCRIRQSISPCLAGFFSPTRSVVGTSIRQGQLTVLPLATAPVVGTCASALGALRCARGRPMFADNLVNWYYVAPSQIFRGRCGALSLCSFQVGYRQLA